MLERGLWFRRFLFLVLALNVFVLAICLLLLFVWQLYIPFATMIAGVNVLMCVAWYLAWRSWRKSPPVE